MSRTLVPFGTRYPEVFGDFQREMDNLMNRLTTGGNFNGTESFSPLVNVSEAEGEYDVTVDLPGISPDDVNVELKHGELWITGERREEEETKDRKFHRVERYHGRFQRVIRLGDDVDAEKVDAEYRDGVLHISVPKSEAAKPKRIQIRK